VRTVDYADAVCKWPASIAFAEAKDREPGSVLVVYAPIGAQLEANARTHVVEHLVGELAASEFARDVDGLICGHRSVLAVLEFTTYFSIYLLSELNF
jgi:hypothetical protein